MRVEFARSRKNCSAENGARGIFERRQMRQLAPAWTAVVQIECFDIRGRDFVEQDLGIRGGGVPAMRPEGRAKQHGQQDHVRPGVAQRPKFQLDGL
jgi:hypothetical protein